MAASERFLIVAAQFTQAISEALVDGAMETLLAAGIGKDQVELVWVPGCFELPVVAAKAARTDHYAAVICLGCVVRGETAHFDYVASQAAEGIMRASLETEKPIIFGVLTTENMQQALARSGGAKGNKGQESAEAALTMLKVLRQVGEGAR